MLWLIEKAILCKKLKSYYTKRNIFSILVIVIIESIAAIQTIKEKQARVAAHYNFSKCKKQVSDSFEAYIYSISKSNQTIKFKSADSTRTDFTYSFPTPQEEIAKSYIGQRLVKKSNSTMILLLVGLEKRKKYNTLLSIDYFR